MNSYSNRIDFEYIKVQSLKKTEKALSIMEEIALLVESKVSKNSTILIDKVSILSKELSKIFGYKITIIQTEDDLISTYVIPHERNKSNSIYGDMRDRLNVYESLKSNSDVDDIESMLTKSYDELKTVSEHGFKIDLNNATITGLGRNFNQVILVNFRTMINLLNSTPREIIAVILHEVGHVYNYLISISTGYVNSVLTIDTIKNEYLKNKNSPRDILITITEKLGVKNSMIDKKSELELIVLIVDQVINSDINLSQTEAEFTSDMFAVRFGYGVELTSIFHRIDKYDPDSIRIRPYIAGASIYLLAISIVLLLMSTIWKTRLIKGSAISVIISSVLSIVSIRGLNGSYYKSDSIYDISSVRLSRIRQQTIMTLKSTTLSNEEMKSIISQVDFITTVLGVSSIKRGFFEKMMLKFNKERRVVAVNYLVEELLNSDLNLSSARIKTM